MSIKAALRWRPGVAVERTGSAVRLTADGRTTVLGPLPPEGVGFLAGMAAPATAPGPVLGREPVMEGLLGRVGHLVSVDYVACGKIIARHERTVRALGVTGIPDEPVPEQALARLSRFALLRARDDELVLECPTSTHRVVLTSSTARGLATDLARPTPAGALCRGPDATDRSFLLGLWAAVGLVETDVADGTPRWPSERDPALRQWDFHDLLMHGRSRSGRFDAPLGALSLHRQWADPEPAVAGPRGGREERISLPRPDLRELAVRDRPLQDVLERRRSIRSYDEDRPLGLGELSEFLYRTVRDRAVFTPGSDTEEGKVSRPYPSGGGLYEHEFYLTVRRCAGLPPGGYRYDGREHRLERLGTTPGQVAEMLAVAAAATGQPDRPDVLITLCARFQRMSWRYSSIAYANMLRNTGAIYQTMYLAATAMGLAPCGLGNGDADLAAAAFGLDYYRESSVGDFILGTRRPDDSVEGVPLPGWTVLDTLAAEG
jgi:SagB-type dehydrogenase family enzyme